MKPGYSRRHMPKATIWSAVIGLIVTLVLFAGVRQLECAKTEAEFRKAAGIELMSIDRGFSSVVYELETINRLFKTVATVDASQFSTFCKPLLLRSTFIQALTYERFVKSADLPQFEKELASSSGNYRGLRRIVDGELRDDIPKSEYRIIQYIEPLADNLTLLGADASSEERNDKIVLFARDSGLAASSGLLYLPSNQGPVPGFVVYMPVYRYGAPTKTVEQRRAAFVGVTSALLYAQQFIAKMLKPDGINQSSSFQISVFSGDHLDESKLVYRTRPTVRDIPAYIKAVLPTWALFDHPSPVTQTFMLGGKAWHAVIATPPLFFTSLHGGSVTVFFAGLLLTLIAAAYLYLQGNRARRIENLVDVRTHQVRLATELMKEDVVARKRAEQALQLRERAIESSANAILITSATRPGYPIEYVNPAFEQITGYTEQDIIGRNFDFLQGEDTDQVGLEEVRAAIREHRSGHAIFRNYRKNGTVFWNDFHVAPVRDDAGQVSHFVTALYDVTAMKRYEAELEHQARHDTLTGLSNRNVLRDRLGQSILYGALYGHQAWILYIDLDRFKFVNDTLGHHAGDALLIKVADRLRTFSRQAETIARLSSDEFVLIVPEQIDERLGVGLIQKIMDLISQPFEIEGHDFFVTCSIGVAVFPTDGEDAETLLKSADIAMYRAKEKGSNTYQFYTASMNDRAMERLRIEGDLRSALERNELVLYYQPQVDLRTGRVVGTEALIRWMHPQLGIISPTRFINLAEETGLIVQIGAWALRTACMQNKAWQKQGIGYLRVSVNLSARQFYQQDLVQSIVDVLTDSDLAPHYLEIELTESLVMSDVDLAIGILRHLKTIGVQLSIDDFGTGYSSLAYLKSFPIDVLKIDQSFVRDICVDRDDAAIVASVISLAHNLRLQVIAEGVETQEQLAYLQRHQCDEMQGFYFSAPVPAHEIEIMLAEGKSLR